MSNQGTFKARLLLTLLLGIVPLLLFIFYIFDLWYDTARSSVLDNSINQAKLMATIVKDSFRTGITATNIITESFSIKSLISKDPSSVQDALRVTIANVPDISNINISDTSGKTIVASDGLTEEQNQNIALADQDYFQQVLLTKKTAVSSPLIGRFTGSQIIVIASPLMDNGKITAVVTSAYALEFLKNKLEKILPDDEKHTFLLYDKNNRLVLILYKPLPNDEEKTIFNNLPFLRNNEENKIKIIENLKLPNSDKLYMGASVSIDDFGGTIVNLVSTDDIFAPLYKIQGVTWLILLVALLFALSLISYTLRKIKMVY